MFIDNESKSLYDVLKKEIKKTDEIIISSPFISSTDLIYKILETDIKFTLIFRLSHPATPNLLEKLLLNLTSNKKIFFYDSSVLHSKIYLFKKNGGNISAIIGSSNFTYGGMRDNFEFNILIKNNLDEVEKYLNSIIKKSEGKLSQTTIDYYKTFYEAPNTKKRHKKRTITLAEMKSYQMIMEKWSLIKGVLEEYNTTDLPFTYVYDAFCHYFKVGIRKDYNLKEFNEFKKNMLIKYFKIFIKDYFTEETIERRRDKLSMCSKIRNNIDTISINQLRQFFLIIHSIISGSGSGVRTAYFQSEAKKSEMKGLLAFIIKERLSMEEKYALGLLKQEKGGEKIKYVGKSALGEISGWLFPQNYPIINGKFHYLLKFFKI